MRMSGRRWLWAVGVVALALIINTWIALGFAALTVAILYEPLWAKLAKGGEANFSRQRKPIAIIFTAILALASFGAIGRQSTQSQLEEANKTFAETEQTMAALQEQFPGEKLDQKWEYTRKVDPLTDKVSRTACITSRNAVLLNAPYEATRARLCLRDSPQHGKDAYIKLEKDGQILCEYNGCQVAVRFDKKKARKMTAGGSDDHTSNILFIADRALLEREIKSAETVIIQPQFYQAGNQAITFDVKGLDWKS